MYRLQTSHAPGYVLASQYYVRAMLVDACLLLFFFFILHIHLTIQTILGYAYLPNLLLLQRRARQATIYIGHVDSLARQLVAQLVDSSIFSSVSRIIQIMSRSSRSRALPSSSGRSSRSLCMRVVARCCDVQGCDVYVRVQCVRVCTCTYVCVAFNISSSSCDNDNCNDKNISNFNIINHELQVFGDV